MLFKLNCFHSTADSGVTKRWLPQRETYVDDSLDYGLEILGRQVSTKGWQCQGNIPR